MAATPKPIDTGVVVGQVFLGKYRVDAILGHGAMGVVAECTHLQLQDRVAIKMLRPDVLADDDAVQRFQREAQASARLKSEYVAKVTDVGTFETGVPYMVMEYLDGQDLGQLLVERRQLPVPWVAELMLQAAEALSEAHSIGIVHRDVKPTNLFVTWRPDGSALVKVLDFGISKSAAGQDMQLTQTQSLLGTPAYMSPEQMRSARLVDLRSDIWSLGTVLYEAVEGRRPFEAESFSEMCVKVAVDPPLPMRNAPLGLQPVILRCLAKTPEQRYANMAELGRDLLPFTQDRAGGQIMVERMERLVRRSGGEWSDSGTSGGARIPTPQPGQLRASTPQIFTGDAQAAAQPWAGGSQPAAQPWAGGTDPAAAGFQSVDAERSGAAHPLPAASLPALGEQTLRVGPQAKRRTAWVVLAGVLVLAGVAIGVGVATTTGPSKADRATARPTAAPPAPAPITAAPPAPAPAAVAAPAPTPAPIATGSATGSGSASAPVGEQAAAAPPSEPPPASVEPAGPVRPTPRPVATQRPHPPTASPRTIQHPASATPPGEEPAHAPPPPPTPPPAKGSGCDPFAAAHHC